MKRILFFTFALVLLVAQPAIAAEHDASTESLHAQLGALTSYMSKLLSQTGAPFPVLSASEMEETIRDGVTWLLAAQEESGHFRYEYVPYEDRYRNDDNIVRQTGAFFQLGEIARLDTEGAYDLAHALDRSASYFESASINGEHDGEKFRCIAEERPRPNCKLGASALALIGLLDFVAAYPEYEDEYEDLIHAYGSYMLAAKKPDAGFRYYYYLDTGFRSQESSFSNGEALFALVRYFEYAPSDEVKTVIDDTFAYFDTETPYDSPLYLWVMAALKDMHTLWPQDAYLEYAKEYTDWRINGFRTFTRTAHNMCAYAEGLASATILLKDHVDPATYSRYQDELDFWLSKNQTLQITDADTMRLVIDESGARFEELQNPSRAIGGFLTAHDEPLQRIDFTQHCLSAYAQTLVEIRGESL